MARPLRAAGPQDPAETMRRELARLEDDVDEVGPRGEEEEA